MRTDTKIQRDVLDELKWEPGLDHEKVGVSVDEGVVTLSGIVGSYAERLLAEKTARGVKGVRAIAENMIVRYAGDKKSSDAEIAQRVSDVLDWDAMIPRERVSVTVENGVVKLSGEVDWHYQKVRAHKCAAKISGVIRVANLITIKASVDTGEVKDLIRQAFERQADLDATRIQVRADGDRVILSGSVSSWAERQVAERTAWAAPGVSQLEDNLVIS